MLAAMGNVVPSHLYAARRPAPANAGADAPLIAPASLLGAVRAPDAGGIDAAWVPAETTDPLG